MEKPPGSQNPDLGGVGYRYWLTTVFVGFFFFFPSFYGCIVIVIVLFKGIYIYIFLLI